MGDMETGVELSHAIGRCLSRGHCLALVVLNSDIEPIILIFLTFLNLVTDINHSLISIETDCVHGQSPIFEAGMS